MSYRVTVVDDDGVVLDEINIDGLDLSKGLTQGYVGGLVAGAMGMTHVAACAAREEPLDEL